MDLNEFRQEMTSYRVAADRDATDAKDSMAVLDRLYALYRRFHADERALADLIVAECALSDDENTRYDAMALIKEFRISAAIPALCTLSRRHSSSTAPGAPFEKRKADRIVAELNR
jgi:hypothetical protein